MPEGNLTEMANDTTGSLAVGVMSILWIFWIAFSLFIPWPNSEYTNEYDPPILFLWTLECTLSMFESWFPFSYLMAWIINATLFIPELLAWMAGGPGFIFWMQICTWGGVVLTAFPVFCIAMFIWVEWPSKLGSGTQWSYIFWSGEFIMLSFQLTFWFVSFLIHILSLQSVINMVYSRMALELMPEGDMCVCDPCDFAAYASRAR